MLVKLVLSLALVLAPVVSVANPIFEGGWNDGTTFLWQCQKGAVGNVKFQFILPSGQTYNGTLSCGQAV